MAVRYVRSRRFVPTRHIVANANVDLVTIRWILDAAMPASGTEESEGPLTQDHHHAPSGPAPVQWDSARAGVVQWQNISFPS
jgi:hypothetical protein